MIFNAIDTVGSGTHIFWSKKQTKQHAQVIYFCVSLWSPWLCLIVRGKMSIFFDDHCFPYQKNNKPRVATIVPLGRQMLRALMLGVIGFWDDPRRSAKAPVCRNFGHWHIFLTNATICCGFSSIYIYIYCVYICLVLFSLYIYLYI